jgi:L-alanine-DL-glutamate epimerase-like enolase superfamily enzyme
MNRQQSSSIGRRGFLRGVAASMLAGSAGMKAGAGAAAAGPRSYGYLGRTDDYVDFRIIEPGLTIRAIETWTQGGFGIVRITASDGREGWGQLSPFEPETTALVLHRQVARQVLGQDASRIDAIVDRVIDANMKYPWSFVCRALTGIDTAIWDLYGRIREQPVWQLLGGRPDPLPVYGSSMRRDISPEDEAQRLVRLRDSHGFGAFKVRVGTPTGHDRDAAPGRTPKLIPTIRAAVGPEVKLLADANSCYTPPRAIEVGRLMEEHGYFFFEEPCPYWELEWTAEVADALQMNVAGGEQDNDTAQFRRMIRMNAVDILQPDICYVGGLTRALRVAKMAQQAGKMVVPHSANLSMVTIFTLHMMAAIPNPGPFVEFTIEPGINTQRGDLYSPVLKVEDGRVRPPDGPGWGVTVNPEWLAKARHEKSEQKG